MIESGFKSDRGMFVRVSRVLVLPMPKIQVLPLVSTKPANRVTRISARKVRSSRTGSPGESWLARGLPRVMSRSRMRPRPSARILRQAKTSPPPSRKQMIPRQTLPLSKSPSRSRSKPDGCKIPMALGITSQIRRPSPRQVGLPLVAPGIGCNRTQTARWPRPSGLPTRTRNTT